MSYYHKMIIEATNCNPEDAALIEDLMRHTIFHSSLDWQTRRQFNAGARKAKGLLEYMRSPEGIATIEKVEREMFGEHYEQYKSMK